jgi:MFS transporter, DHA1 family, tetracycline resistance protein
LHKSLIPIFLVIVVDILGMTIILPLLPFYAEQLGASATTVGLLVSIFAFCQLIGGPVLGRLSDQFGRRPLLLVSQSGTLIGFIILAYANNLWLLFLSRVIDGFTAGNISLAQAYIADVTQPEERTKSFAIIGIAFGLGFLIGPAVSGFLSQYGYIYPVLVAIVLSSASIAATYFLLPPTTIAPDASDSRRLGVLEWGQYLEYFRKPGLKTVLWQFFLFIFAFSLFFSGFPLFAERRYTWEGKPFGAKEVGYVYAYVGSLSIIVQGGLIPRLARMVGDWRLVRGGFLFSTIGFAILGFTFDVPELLATAALVTFATGVIRPASTSLITQLTSRGEQGSVLGLTQALQSIAQIVAPFLAGLLIDHGQLAAWAMTAALFCGTGFMIRRPVEVRDILKSAASSHR